LDQDRRENESALSDLVSQIAGKCDQLEMNRKQKGLTVIALIAFVIVGAFHYLGWPPLHLIDYETKKRIVNWELLDWQKAKVQMQRNEEKWFSDDAFDLAFAHTATYTHGYVDVVGDWQSYTGTGSLPRNARVWIPELGVFKEPYLNVWIKFENPKYAIVPDVRVPWFMLGVIYTGVFFLLAGKKEKR
jgi:hypothetical protein